MKSVKPADLERQTRLDPAVRFTLLTGPDEATMEAAAHHLIGLAGKDAERLDLTGSQLAQDPSLLAAEAASMSLFSPSRIIRLELTGSGDDSVAAVEALLAAETAINPATATPAAVLVPVVPRESSLSVLLTKRTDHLHHHPGQISFPGGRVEEADDSAVTTALRETEEEIGLERRHVELLGALPDYFTGTGFRVTPVVGLVHPPFRLHLDAFEVAESFEVPLSHFLDPANHQRHSMIYQGRLRHFHAMPYHHYYIWGATAGIIMSLYKVLREG